MRQLFAFSFLAFFVFISIHVSALNYGQRVVAEEKKINKPAVLSNKEKIKKDQLKKTHEVWLGRSGKIGGDVVRINSRSTFKNEQDYSFYRKPHQDGKTERAVARYHSSTSRIEGVEARINLWQPSVDREKAHSSSQIWIESNVNGNLNVIEVGWHVSVPLFHQEFQYIFFLLV
ncbi:uncharacterized protein LOC120010581 [Tripterygium wilfordii]|uniref:uncharacterized protein LOC120010581 n=1 Tax=Tripterygium wilfordii TaxID=458696 RepID=UPI0018F85FB8|nr:uncharacterized protein LOC120010581 [Tripterygium wilfordii]